MNTHDGEPPAHSGEIFGAILATVAAFSNVYSVTIFARCLRRQPTQYSERAKPRGEFVSAMLVKYNRLTRCRSLPQDISLSEEWDPRHLPEAIQGVVAWAVRGLWLGSDMTFES